MDSDAIYFTLVITLFIIVFFALATSFILFIDSKQCASRATASNVEYQYDFWTSCVVKVNNQWIPYDRWWLDDNR